MSKVYLLVLFLFVLVLNASCGSSGSSDDDSDTPPVSDDGSNGDDTGGGGDSGGDGSDPGGDTGSGDENPTERNIRQVGYVAVIEDIKAAASLDSGVTATARFLEYTKPFTTVLAEVDDPFASAVDTCKVSANNNENGPVVTIPKPEEQIEERNIGAGTPLSITSDGNDYLDIVKIGVSDDLVLYGSRTASGNMEPNLKLNIPGDEFPAFSGIAIGDVGGFKFDSPGQGSTIRFNTQFQWQPASDPDDLVFIDASSLNQSVSCITRDTGSFTFPEETQNEMGTGFFGNKLTGGRLDYQVLYSGESMLIVYAHSISR